MATYEEIYGKRVDVLSSDPTLTAANEGQVWYNSTSGTLKSVLSSAVVVSATALPTATRASQSIGAAQDSMILATGANPGTNYSTNCFEYNGSGWTTVSSAGTARDQANRSGGVGTVTAGMIAGGAAPGSMVSNTETYDGSSWTETGNLSDSRGDGEMFGTKTAAALTGGYNSFTPPYWTNATEEFNGTSWTGGTASPLNTTGGCGCGTQTAGMIVGQRESPSNSYPGKAAVTQTRFYDGSAWSLGGTTNMAANANITAGTQSAAQKAGGAAPAPASYTNTEAWDGTSWTTGASLGSAFSNGCGAGTATASVFAGGQTPPGNLATVQEITQSIGTISAAAWASGTGLNTGREGSAAGGTQTAGIAFGGYTGTAYQVVAETYDGSSWTEVGDLSTAREWLGGAGTQTAALAFGGKAAPNAGTADSEEYNGTSWTEGSNLGTARAKLAGFGTQTAALGAGGYSSPPETTWGRTEEYNGASWSEQTDLSTARRYLQGFGTQTAGLVAGGYVTTAQTATEEYNGASWTNGGALIASIYAGGTAGATSSAGIIFGGFNPGQGSVITYGYDGTAWSTRPSMGSGRSHLSGTGTTTAGLAIGGQNPPSTKNLQTVEEFTGEVETTAAKTLTTS